MKTTTLFIISMCISMFGNAQSDSSQQRKKVFFKVSYDLLQYRPGDLLIGGGVQLSFVNFSLAAGFYDKKQKHFHEFALSRFYYTNLPAYKNLAHKGSHTDLVVGGKKDGGFGFRYEYNLKLGKRSDRKSKFYMGFPVECYYVHQSFIPLYSTSFNYWINGFGFSVGVVPRYQYWFTKNFYLDVALPITAYEGLVSEIKDSNPNIPIRERSTTDYRHYLNPPVPNFRIGLGVKI